MEDYLLEEQGITICPISKYGYTYCDEKCENCSDYIEFVNYYKEKENGGSNNKI